MKLTYSTWVYRIILCENLIQNTKVDFLCCQDFGNSCVQLIPGSQCLPERFVDSNEDTPNLKWFELQFLDNFRLSHCNNYDL